MLAHRAQLLDSVRAEIMGCVADKGQIAIATMSGVLEKHAVRLSGLLVIPDTGQRKPRPPWTEEPSLAGPGIAG